jgi:hypothetical protein
LRPQEVGDDSIVIFCELVLDLWPWKIQINGACPCYLQGSWAGF